jgi:hypothetical protein
VPRQLHAFLKRAFKDKKYLKCGKSRFIKVVNEDGDMVMTEFHISSYVTFLSNIS